MTYREVFASIVDRAEAVGWVGPDPYDGLASGLGRCVIPLGSLPRFAFSQFILRVPLARAFARPTPTVNAKGLALFLGATVRGRDLLGSERAHLLGVSLCGELDRLAIPSGSGSGWGYPFPWQSRSFWAPANTPNAVVTATVGWHLLEFADAFGDERARSLGQAAARFLAGELNISRVGDAAAISYTQADHSRVVNISALAARLLARVAGSWRSAANPNLHEELARFVLQEQRADGSWPYAAGPGGSWEDSFHTGYVLEAIICLREQGIAIPDDALVHGLAAYGRFFNSDGGARLFVSPTSLFDAHSAAQGVVTYATLEASPIMSLSTRREARETALRIASWALEALWVARRGHFAYRMHGGRRDEREFTRWVQAWMSLAMATASGLEVGETVSRSPASSLGVA